MSNSCYDLEGWKDHEMWGTIEGIDLKSIWNRIYTGSGYHWCVVPGLT